MAPTTWLTTGALLGAAAVAAGAFGAHGLKSRVTPEDLAIFETAARYQLIHALALLAVGWIADRWPGAFVNAAGVCFVGGIAIFSGSLYLLVLTGARWLGAITPIGGLALILGWLALAFGTLRAS